MTPMGTHICQYLVCDPEEPHQSELSRSVPQFVSPLWNQMSMNGPLMNETGIQISLDP